MLIAKLTLNAQAERRAMTNIQRLVVECEGHDRLRMQGVDQVNAFIIRDAAHEICAMENDRSEEHTSELQSLMRISYAVFCLKKKNTTKPQQPNKPQQIY